MFMFFSHLQEIADFEITTEPQDKKRILNAVKESVKYSVKTGTKQFVILILVTTNMSQQNCQSETCFGHQRLEYLGFPSSTLN